MRGVHGGPCEVASRADTGRNALSQPERLVPWETVKRKLSEYPVAPCGRAGPSRCTFCA